MTGARKLLLIAGAAALVTGTAAATPFLLRKLDAFQVQRVAVAGNRYLPATDAVIASGITRTNNVFEKPDAWERKLTRHPLIHSARVERQLPGTLVLHLVEAVPVALMAMPDLRPVSVDGVLLPVPAHHPLDLPVLSSTHARVRGAQILDAPTLAALGALVRLQEDEPELSERISEAHVRADALRLVLRAPAGAEAWIALHGNGAAARQVKVALADLTARSEAHLLERVDARFADQVVVVLKEDTAKATVAIGN